jgi:hypothetical protein
MQVPSKFCPQTILLVPDIHAKPGDDLTRLDTMAEWLRKRRLSLTKIVQIGDAYDMASLCLHDKESPEWYERNLSDDLAAGDWALDKLVMLAQEHDLLQSDVIFTLGNHEDRYDKFMAADNRLRTGPFTKTLKGRVKKQYPHMTVVDFLKPHIFAGIAFQHYFTSGVMGRPQGGENIANNLLRNQFMPVVCGHTHIYSYAERTDATGRKVQALCAGCFVDPNLPVKYARGTNHLWRNGITLLHVWDMGQYDLEFVSLERLNKTVG